MDNIEYFDEYKGISIFIKRDDRIPFSFGGNKVRIAYELFKDIEDGGYTSVISYGSPSSNMNRAIAEMSQSKGIKCYVIIKLESDAVISDNAAEAVSDKSSAAVPGSAADAPDDGSLSNAGKCGRQAESCGKTQRRPVTVNERLVCESGAEIIYCTDGKVRECVESVMKLSSSRGEKPYYIYGGSDGSGNEISLMRASYREYDEIEAYEHECGTYFDAVILTAGTGATISGLAAAVHEAEAAGARPAGTRLIGISAARGSARELEVVRRNLDVFGADRGVEYMHMPEIIDRYLCGGYGSYDGEIEQVISQAEKRGLPLDPTYTGKSFRGMLEEAELGSIQGRILFIHTGGYPVYLDYCAGRKCGKPLPAPSAFT